MVASPNVGCFLRLVIQQFFSTFSCRDQVQQWLILIGKVARFESYMLKLRHSPESRIHRRFYGGASLYTSPYKRL